MPKKKHTELNKKFRSIILISFLAIVVISIFLYLLIKEKPAGKLEDSKIVIAVVNGEKITKRDYNDAYSRVAEPYKALVSKEEIINQLVDKRLLLQEANAQDIIITESEAEQQLSLLKQQFPTEDIFIEVLTQQNLTVKDLEAEIRESMMITRLLNKSILSIIEVSEDEISEYYKMNQNQFIAMKGQIRAAHILVSSEEDAQKILDLLSEGRNFTELALEFSIDPSVEFNKGYLGFFSEGSFGIKEFDAAAFSLKVGEFSIPVKTYMGYHIIMRLPNRISIEEAREQIFEAIIESKQKQAIVDFISKLRSNGNIKLYLDSLQAEKQDDDFKEHSMKTINNFKLTGDEVCTENGKPIIRRYVSSSCKTCKEVESAFKTAVSAYDVIVLEWELDTGDDLYTSEIEASIPVKEYEILKKYNPNFAVPSYLFGCKYLRIGNAFSKLNLPEEESIFRQTIEELL